MDRKKILIVIFALIVLIGCIFFVVLRGGARGQKNNVGQNSVKTQKSTDASDQKQNKQAAVILEALGSVVVATDKTITIKEVTGLVTEVNISAATPVIILEGTTKSTPGLLADVKVKDLVKVTYDATTKNATMISIARSQAMGKVK